ncbi:MAG: type II secretion system secretin GspD [Desulfobacteraceae bacterium]|nr:type II secretion system secretin GspD [Desulfobacteraceae bacterium]
MLILWIFVFQMAVMSWEFESFAQDPENDVSPESNFVAIDFNNVDINVFIKFISKLTNKNFVVDPRVKGNVTIISPTKISIKEAYKVFETVLEINGFSTVTAGKIVKIIPSPKAKADNVDTRIATGPSAPGMLKDQIVTRIVPLNYAQSDELKNLFTPLVPKGSVVLSYRDTNMLIITATLSSIDRLLRIIQAIDIQSIGQAISVIPIQYADAKKIVKNLSSVYAARRKTKKSKPGSDLTVKFVADERTNAVILLASKVETERVKNLIEILDKKVPKGEENIRVYYLEHASAENIVKVLQAIPTKDEKKAPGQKKAPILSESVKITADKSTNSVIIMAEKDDYPVLEGVIAKLDIPRAMVYIEALLMEVNVVRGLNLGTEWSAAQGFNNNEKAYFGGFGATGATGHGNTGTVEAGSLPQGFSVGVLGKDITIGGVTFKDISAVIQAFQSDKDVHILANPQILTTENEEASITVGKNVAFQTRSAAESGVETYNSYEYKDVGVSLKITPQISKDRLIRLNVYQQVTKLDTVNTSSPDRPTTLKREIETTIIVEDGNSVAIGGLIDETLTKTDNKTPCIGDIPLLGFVFKSVDEGQDKTNLYVFLTPRVVKNPLEAEDIYKEKKKLIDDEIQKGEVPLYDKINKN